MAGHGWAPTLAGPVLVSGQGLLDWRRQQLAAGGRAADLDWLLDLAGGLHWQQLQALRLHPERSVGLRCSLGALEDLWRRHLTDQEPLQYLVGRCPWRDMELAVAPGVLIPRQETELLVDLAAERASELVEEQAGAPVALWADLGTGSGCLALALARLWPASQGLAVDLSAAARAQAAANLTAAGVADRVQVLDGAWWQPLAPWRGQLQLVVSNPPYIPTADWQRLAPLVRDHEPALALDGGGDGLAAIRVIAAGALAHLAPGGWLLLEHHHDQSAAVQRLLTAAGLVAVGAHRDLEGKERFAVGRRPAALPLQP